MEADGLSTDRRRESRLGGGRYPLAAEWKACVRVRCLAVPGGCRFGLVLCVARRLVSMSGAGSQTAGWSFFRRKPPSEGVETPGTARPAALRTTKEQLVPQGGTACLLVGRAVGGLRAVPRRAFGHFWAGAVTRDSKLKMPDKMVSSDPFRFRCLA
jgi:hypothetical protein